MRVKTSRKFLSIFRCDRNGAQQNFTRVTKVSKSPTFQIESPRACAVLECANCIQSLSTEAELKVLSTVCDQFYGMFMFGEGEALYSLHLRDRM